MDEIEIWHVLVSAGVLAFVVEIFTLGFIFGAIGVGFFFASVGSYLKLDTEWVILLFALGVGVTYFLIKPLMSKIDKDDVKMNHEALIGKVGVVSEKITKNNLSGRVKVGGDDWRALSEDGEEIEINEQVVVLKIDSIQLVVKKNN